MPRGRVVSGGQVLNPSGWSAGAFWQMLSGAGAPALYSGAKLELQLVQHWRAQGSRNQKRSRKGADPASSGGKEVKPWMG